MRKLLPEKKLNGCSTHPHATHYNGICLQCFMPKNMDTVMELRGDGFKLFADVIDPDPKNSNIRDRDLTSIRHTLVTKYSELIPHKTPRTVKYRGITYVVNRRRDYILITKEETK